MTEATASGRSGFVAIVGRPNVGKSTLLNALLGEKIAITSPRPQTTRRRVLGVLTRPDCQVVFLDTPGWHEAEHALGRLMLESAKAAMEEADVIVMVVDGRSRLTDADRRVLERLNAFRGQVRPGGRPVRMILAVNKADVARKPDLLPLMEAGMKTGLFEECVPLSALTGEQVDVLLRLIIDRLPPGPRWYEPEQRTDQPVRLRVAELVREQVLRATRQEIPHAVAVLVDTMDDEGALTRIQATILVERDGQKAIVIGRGGSMLKAIGTAARLELERLLGRKVFLGLWVKVAEGWRTNERLLRELGYFEPGER